MALMEPLSPVVTDNLWAVCELIATAFMIGQIIQIRKDRQIRGVHWYLTAFYIGWGVINIPSYASLGQFHAMWAGALMTVANIVWLSHALRYRRFKPAPDVPVSVQKMQAARLLRAAAEDGLLSLKALANNTSPGMGALMVAQQARTNLENAIGVAQIRGIDRAWNIDGDGRPETVQDRYIRS